jgi:MFS family permease
VTSDSDITYLELITKYRSFRYFYVAHLISLFGDWFNLIAVFALLKTMGAGSASAFGGTLIIKSLPTVIVSPWAGLLADMFSRKKIMIVSDILRAIVVLSMFVAIWNKSYIGLCSLLALQAAISGFFQPANTALLPDLVPKEALTAANALNATTWSVMLTVGAAIGGVVTEYFGWEIALIVDACSYIVSALFLLPIVSEYQETSSHPKTEETKPSIREGFAYIARHRDVLFFICVKGGWNFVGALTLMLSLLGEHTFSHVANSVLMVSFFYAVRGLGTGIGPILSRTLTKSKIPTMERFIGYGFLLGGAFYLILPLMTNIWFAAICIIIAHIGGATCWVFSTIRLQQILPSAIRGRVFATEQAIFVTMFTFSNLFYGAAFDNQWFSLNALFVCMGVSLFIPAILWFVFLSSKDKKP